MAVTDLLTASTVDAYTFTWDRAVATAAAVVALGGVVVGALALLRPATRAGDRAAGRRPVVAIAAGVIGVVAGGLVVATADGGPGTGNGIVGGYAALAFGPVACLLGGLARARARRVA
ncbi:DUF6223 family protein [Micromonospora sp. DT31]|uniref:DUF6223 family protein n=1 Tax=Micromonospora sp. DT31 TaxID=3393434 RepID=UPI003CE699CB